ncbi:hypothetical protein [Sphingobacterium griseoflavum]|uniref:Uncharacterized protein n=1 Tax=Sphingobacterium griseoflavum TaxID=1474952 RepID=A0ABQ3HW72_9SPHI|nr:hypothetical protein [Sphingobacterium griseoflavum]GHE40678.1 hypothetical protein GCM10017764_24890 [Sphingobacterium griseoflavum]
MKGILVIFFTLLSLGSIDLDTVRKYFEESKNSKAATDNLYKLMQEYRQEDPVLLAYKGAALTLQARYLTERSEKKKMVSQGIALIERAVKLSPKQVEVRLIRLAVQEHSPKILKYKTDIGEDKQFILSNLSSQPSAIRSMVKRYAKQSQLFTADEQRKLSQ